MRIKSSPRRKTDTKWHRWYAWHPVKLETGDWIWLEPVWRRLIPSYEPYWEYSDTKPK